jgi:hypothetical protein
LGAALEYMDTMACPHVLVAPFAVKERIRRFPQLRAVTCPDAWAALQLTILKRMRNRSQLDVDRVVATVFGLAQQHLPRTTVSDFHALQRPKPTT